MKLKKIEENTLILHNFQNNYSTGMLCFDSSKDHPIHRAEQIARTQIQYLVHILKMTKLENCFCPKCIFICPYYTLDLSNFRFLYLCSHCIKWFSRNDKRIFGRLYHKSNHKHDKNSLHIPSYICTITTMKQLEFGNGR